MADWVGPVILGTAIVAVVLAGLIRMRMFYRRASRAEATMLGHEWTRARGSGACGYSGGYGKAIVEFVTADGKLVRTREIDAHSARKFHRRWVTGTRVPVYYDPANPEKVHVAGGAISTLIALLSILAVGLALIVLPALFPHL